MLMKLTRDKIKIAMTFKYSYISVDKVEELQKLMELTMSKIESEEGRMNLDIKSLVAINQYCTKAFSLVKH